MNLETKDQEKFYLIDHKLHDKQFHKRLLCAFLKNEGAYFRFMCNIWLYGKPINKSLCFNNIIKSPKYILSFFTNYNEQYDYWYNVMRQFQRFKIAIYGYRKTLSENVILNDDKFIKEILILWNKSKHS